MAVTPYASGNWPMLTVPGYSETQIPKAPKTLQYLAPQPDLSRIQFLTQMAAGPGVRKLRKGLTGSLQEAGRAENPNVRALLSRGALSGYGEGLESVMGGARREGMSLYAPEFATTSEESKANWLAKREEASRNYETLLSKYFSQKPSGMSRPSGGRLPDTYTPPYKFPDEGSIDEIYQRNKLSATGVSQPSFMPANEIWARYQ